jgi:hypothetical protein
MTEAMLATLSTNERSNKLKSKPALQGEKLGNLFWKWRSGEFFRKKITSY